MADYKDAYDFSWKEKEPSVHKLAAEDAETSARRITQGSFNTGGFITPGGGSVGHVAPKVQHKIAFESEGPTFTVQELVSGLSRVPNAGKTSTVKIISWSQYHGDPENSRNAQVAVVEWVE